MATKTMTCKNCGATMEVDEEKGIKFCPYCGSAELIDSKDNTIVKLARIHAATKKREAEEQEKAEKEGRAFTQKEMIERNERNARNQSILGFIVLFAIMIMSLLMVIIFKN